MDEQEKLFYRIEDYLLGELPEDEARAFEQLMAADPELAAAVEKQRFERMGMEYLLEKDLRAKMLRWKAEDSAGGDAGASGRSFGKSPLRRPWLWWALGGLILAAWGGWAYYFQKKSPPVIESVTEPAAPAAGPADTATVAPPPTRPMAERRPAAVPPPSSAQPDTAEKILAFHESPGHLLGQLRGAPTATTNLADALKAYEAGRYAEVIRLLSSGAPTDDGRELLAHAYFKNGQYDQAAARFRQMAGEGYGGPVQDRMEWNLLLSLLMQHPLGNAETAALLAKMLAPENYHDYQSKAGALEQALR